ncbi:MAG: CCDC90 family protein [Alphaproteobacteria bacterium]
MSTLAIDTFRIIKRLKEAGFTEPQAETVTDVLREAREADLQGLATKADLREMELRGKADLREMELRGKAEMLVLKWMVGFNLALSVAIVTRLLMH